MITLSWYGNALQIRCQTGKIILVIFFRQLSSLFGQGNIGDPTVFQTLLIDFIETAIAHNKKHFFFDVIVPNFDRLVIQGYEYKG